MANTKHLDYRLLGSLEVWAGGEQRIVAQAKPRAVLALLALDLNRPVPTDRLVEHLWPEKAPGRPKTAVQGYVSGLRKLLGDATIETTAVGYVLRGNDESVDVRRFERLALEGAASLAAGDIGRAAQLLRDGLNLWRGPALADFAYEAWAQPEIGRLEELRTVAREEEADAQLALGRHAELVGELETLVNEHPLRERPRGQLMTALYRSGRQAEALETYRHAREQLLNDLGIDPGHELQVLYRQILNQDEALTASVQETVLTNLAVPANALIGREKQLAQVEALLAQQDVQLVTLTGVGGTGKTRLAQQVAFDLLDHFRDGVFFVSLATITDPSLVMSTVAQTLGVAEQPGQSLLETLQAHLRNKDSLLLLDNFEQVSDAATDLALLLRATGKPKLLVTSRWPLHLGGEREYQVPPLALPGLSDVEDLETFARFEAVALFLERAQAVEPDFVLSRESALAVAEICTRLDGLPLAIELAAARTRILSVQALLRRLDERLKLLTGGVRDAERRQRTLRDTIEWSYDLLDEHGQALFARLSVFRGGCRLEAAEAVCDPNHELTEILLDALESLVEQNLVRRRMDADHEPRFWMLETIREYALAVLAETGRGEEVAGRHFEHFVALVARADEESRRGDLPSWFGLLDADRANVRDALEWAKNGGDWQAVTRLATGLWGYWSARGHVSEGIEWLDAALAHAEEEPSARTLLGLCALRHLAGWDNELLLADARSVVLAAEQIEDDFTLAQAWNLIGRIEASGLGDHVSGERSWQRALAYAERGNYRSERSESMGWLMVMSVFGLLPTDQGISRCKAFVENARQDTEGTGVRAGGDERRLGSDARRVRPCPPPSGRRHAALRDARTERVGGEQRTGSVLRRDAHGEPRGRIPRPARKLSGARADGGARLPLDDRGVAGTCALLKEDTTTKPNVSAS